MHQLKSERELKLMSATFRNSTHWPGTITYDIICVRATQIRGVQYCLFLVLCLGGVVEGWPGSLSDQYPEQHIWPRVGQEGPSKAMSRQQGGVFAGLWSSNFSPRRTRILPRRCNSRMTGEPPTAFQNYAKSSETYLVTSSDVL